MSTWLSGKVPVFPATTTIKSPLFILFAPLRHNMPPAHISLLPTEILAEIFYQHIQAANPYFFWKSSATLCQVSRRWKTVTQSHARLWSTIRIDLGRIYTSPPVEILELWLERSGGAPLEIYFSHAEPDETEWHWLGSQLLDCLILHIHRWKHFTTSFGRRMTGLVDTIPLGEAHQLESASFTLYGYFDSHSDEDKFISTLASAPQLRSLKLESNSRRIAQRLVISSPWERLINVALKLPVTLSGMLHIMRACPSAIEMCIHNYPRNYEYQGTNNPPSIVSLPSLRALKFSNYTIGYEIFNHLDFPNLQVLHVEMFYNTMAQDRYDIAPISRSLSSSQCSLQVLMVADGGLQSRQLPTFLSDPAIAKVPVVKVWTRRPPNKIRRLVNEIVGTHPGAQRVTPLSAPKVSTAFMGWTNRAIYESLKGYLDPAQARYRH